MRLHRSLVEKTNFAPASLLGVIAETVVIEPGETGTGVVRCSDESVIDLQLGPRIDVAACVGAAVVIERTDVDTFHLHWLPRGQCAGRPEVPPWVDDCIAKLDAVNARERSEAKEELSRIDPFELGGIYGLLRALQHKEYLVRAAATEVLASLAPHAVPTLIELGKRNDLGVEKDVEAILARVGKRSLERLRRARRVHRYPVTSREKPMTGQSPSKRAKKATSASVPNGLVECSICKARVKRSRLTKHKRKAHGIRG